jgi:arginyl-tRNA synthetase
MALQALREQAAEAISDTLEQAFGHRPENVSLEIPPRRELGDLAWPGALPLAKVLRRAPRQIAETVAEKAAWPAGVSRVEIAGPGFLNLYLERDTLLQSLLRQDGETEASTVRAAEQRGKQVIEHTNINPNKAAHIGHLRNAVLGDILVRCLRHDGHPVEVQNYIDDTGVQVADVVVGLLYLPETELASAIGVDQARRDHLLREVVRRMPGSSVPQASVSDFDDLCWEVYPRVTNTYQADESLKARRAEVLHAVEQGFGSLGVDQALHLLGGAAIAGQEYHPQHRLGGCGPGLPGRPRKGQSRQGPHSF